MLPLSVTSDEQLLELRRKLEALGFDDPFDRSSAPLVRKLLDDLIHSTESLRALKVRRSSRELCGLYRS